MNASVVFFRELRSEAVTGCETLSSWAQQICGSKSFAMAVAAGSKVPKQVIKSPSMALSYVVSVASLLTGAAVVHNILKPDLTIPDLSSQDILDKDSEKISNTGSVE